MAGLQTFGQVFAQTTAVAAVLYYFGWARENAILSYFNVDPSMLKFSVADYVIRSVVLVIRQLVIVGLLIIGAMYGHHALARWLAKNPAGSRTIRRSVVWACSILGCVACCLGVLGFFDVIVYSRDYPVVPIVLAVGIALLTYGRTIADLDQDATKPSGISGAHAFVLLFVGAALTIWTVGVYASINGSQLANNVIRGLGSRPRVVVYSTNDLGLLAPQTGLRVERISPPQAPGFHFRYSGLRLLIYTSGRYVLLPDRWVRGRDPVLILDEKDGLRFELS